MTPQLKLAAAWRRGINHVRRGGADIKWRHVSWRNWRQRMA